MPAKPPKAGGGSRKTPKEKTPKEKSPKEKPCPICGKRAAEASRPFCSERCRDVDLNRWLSGSYAIPGNKDEDEDAE
jgi:uncharacterized protein